jgi:alpha/beta superfamily hydrolase
MLRSALCDDRFGALVYAGVPVSKYDFSSKVPCTRPKLVIQGELDQFGQPREVEPFFAALDEPKEMIIIPGADHFFEGRLDEMSDAVSRFIASVDRGGPEPRR